MRLLCRQLSLECFRDFVVGGICPAYDRFPFVEIVPNPMVDWNNASWVADSNADELAFLIGLLSKSVNLYATHNLR